MEQLVARRAHNPKVVGSSPAPATSATEEILIGIAQSGFFFEINHLPVIIVKSGDLFEIEEQPSLPIQHSVLCYNFVDRL